MSEPSQDAAVDALVGRAKEAISKADYATALALLHQAVQLAPADREAGLLLTQTEEASRRHRAAVARYQAVLEKSRQISELIEQGDLESAHGQLREAELAYGQQDVFTALDQQLASGEAAAQRTLAAQLTNTARSLLAAGDWRGAFDAAERSLQLEPSPEAREVRDQARAELDQLQEQRHYASAVDEARGDVERLLEARELLSAGQRLRQAVDQLGDHQAFAELGGRIDKAKSDLRFRQRVEWAERRANEAERLIAEADRLSLTGSYDKAVQRLETARELDPSHPDLETKLDASTEALNRQLAEQQRTADLNARLSEIASHLDALRLDIAEQAIRHASLEFGEPARFVPFQTRLDRLREVERSGGALPQVAGALDEEAQAEALRRQRTLAAAYSWKQALLFPFRGFGVVAFWTLAGLLIALDLLAALPVVGGVFAVMGWLVPLVLAGLVPAVVRATFEGRNLLPAWDELRPPKRWASGLVRFAALALVAAIPLLALLATRRWHLGLQPEGGPLGWLAVAFLGWLAVAFIVLAGGAVEAFGQGQLPRLARHVRAGSVGQPEALWIVDGLFGLVLAIVLLRTAVVPAMPWLATPAVRGIEVYALLLAPHLIGLLVRRHRLELSGVYD